MELTRENLIKLDELLNEAYGKRGYKSEGSALDILIRTVLTQATNDKNAYKAFDALKEAFPTWEEVLDASIEDIAIPLKIGGLAYQKAQRIKGILQKLKEDNHELSLDFLEDQDLEDAFKYLTGFHGVGPKTAACTLLFTWCMDVFPVDTHIHRLSRRIGLVNEKATAVQTQKVWQEAIPPGRTYSLHVGLIEHGRKVCRARNPLCHECNLTEVCDYFLNREG